MQLGTLASVREKRDATATALAQLEEQVAGIEADLRALGSLYVGHEPIPEADRERIRSLLREGGITV